VSPRCRARRSLDQVFDVLATEKETSAGSRLTDVNELAARPTSDPPTSAATATTPLGKEPNAWRNWFGSRSWLVLSGWTVMRQLLTG
jgi:hypothetical protein